MGGPLRVLHVVVNMNRGGAETLIMNLYRNIDTEKVQFDFLTCKEGVFDAEILAMGGKLHRIPYVTDTGHKGYQRDLKGFFTANPEYKIVHSHMDKMSGLVLGAAKKAGVPVRIAHSHNTESEGGILTKVYKWYAGNLINLHATDYYACSEAAARWLFKGKSKKAFIMKNGIETDKFQFCQKTRKSIRDELMLDKATFVIGHVGRFSPQKNHLYLIDVFASINQNIPDSVLLLAGDGPLKRKLKKKVEELKLDSKVMFLGVREDINKLLQAFDVFAFPSIHEGLPVTLVEAQGAGLPCFISKAITKEVNMGVGLVKHLSIKDKASWIESIIGLRSNNQSRIIPEDTLLKRGYDIRKTAEVIQSNYLSLGGMSYGKADGVHSYV